MYKCTYTYKKGSALGIINIIIFICIRLHVFMNFLLINRNYAFWFIISYIFVCPVYINISYLETSKQSILQDARSPMKVNEHDDTAQTSKHWD